MIKAISSPNIALIKYWGNRDETLRLPAADSLSMVLDTPTVEAQIEPSNTWKISSFHADGSEAPQSEKSIERLKGHWELCSGYLQSIGYTDLPSTFSLRIHSGIPPAIGIASSAAVFSCLGEVYAGLFGTSLTREQVSILSRLGSGSAGRNSFGGYVALKNHGEGIGSAYGEQIEPEQHWVLHDIILVPSREEKKVGSTEGHAGAASSPLFAARIQDIPRRMQECTDALHTKDFEKLQKVTEEDALDMHRCMETQSPALQYLSDETHRILKEMTALRNNEKLHVLYTMDAGPTVHLLCTEDSLKTVKEFAHAQKNCSVFEAKTGSASRIV